jgi:hypothetical protein
MAVSVTITLQTFMDSQLPYHAMLCCYANEEVEVPNDAIVIFSCQITFLVSKKKKMLY